MRVILNKLKWFGLLENGRTNILIGMAQRPNRFLGFRRGASPAPMGLSAFSLWLVASVATPSEGAAAWKAQKSIFGATEEVETDRGFCQRLVGGHHMAPWQPDENGAPNQARALGLG